MVLAAQRLSLPNPIETSSFEATVSAKRNPSASPRLRANNLTRASKKGFAQRRRDAEGSCSGHSSALIGSAMNVGGRSAATRQTLSASSTPLREPDYR